ncbi:MAG: hypothetical protein ACRDHU_07910 [Actinomycetota bacterium]
MRLAAVAVAFAACAAEAVPPEPPPAGAIPGLRPSAATQLDAETIAADAVDEEALTSLLGEAGFESAVERRYTGAGGEIRRAEVRVVRFGSTDGAERYLAWLEDHVEDVIGDATVADPMSGRSTSVYVHVPDGCCPKETVLTLAAWRDGRDVLRVLVAGPGAEGSTGLELIATFRLRMTTS